MNIIDTITSKQPLCRLPSACSSEPHAERLPPALRGRLERLRQFIDDLRSDFYDQYNPLDDFVIFRNLGEFRADRFR